MQGDPRLSPRGSRVLRSRVDACRSPRLRICLVESVSREARSQMETGLGWGCGNRPGSRQLASKFVPGDWDTNSSDHPQFHHTHTWEYLLDTAQGMQTIRATDSPYELTREFFLMLGGRDAGVRGATLSKPSPGLRLSCFPFASRRLLSPHLSQRPPASTPPFPSHLAAVALSSPPTSPQSPGGAGGRRPGAPAPTRAVPEPHPTLLPRQRW